MSNRKRRFSASEDTEASAEDREDYLLALARLEEDDSRIPLDEVMRRLGLDR